MRPLEGIRVVDFSWVLAGPICTRYLALMGAEVFKVESHRRPDPSRRGEGFQMLNQNKRGVTLNLSHPEGRTLALELVKKSDVVIENFATGVIERMGLGYDVLKAAKPDIIMVSCAGLGHTGPEKGYAAYGTLIQAHTGWSALQGYSGRKPIIGGAYTDPTSGTWLVALIAAALYRRGQTEQGAYLDVSMAEVTINMLVRPLMEYAIAGTVRQPQGNHDDWFAPHNVYPCAGDDQYIAIAVTNDEEWTGLCQALDLELTSDPRFQTAMGRWKHQDELDPIISQETQRFAVMDLFGRLQRAGVPSGPSFDLAQIMSNEHMVHRGFIHPYTDLKGRTVNIPTVPWRMEGVAPAPATPAPELGTDTEYALREVLNISPEKIAQLQTAGVLY
ncbi:MAG: CoA transferase [Chloroflexi bacterium]|nr:CoA transferase [Chloroflexota bacterium]